MRLLVLYLMMASGLLAEEWMTLTLKDGEWSPRERVKSLEVELKGKGLHLVASGETRMETFQWMQKLSHNFGDGRLRLSVTEGDVASVELDGLGDELKSYMEKGIESPFVGFQLIGERLTVGVFGKARVVHMNVDGAGEKAFHRHVKLCLESVPKNEQGKRLCALHVSPLNTLKESMKALKIVKEQSDGRLIFDTLYHVDDDSFPVAWRYPGIAGQSLLDPATRIDLRLEYDSKNQRVTVFNAAGKELKSGEQLRAYYKEKIEHAVELKKPAWLCIEGSSKFLSHFGKPFTQDAADLGIDYVVCRASGTELRLQSASKEEYIFSVDDLRLPDGARFKKRPILRSVDSWMDDSIEITPIYIYAESEECWVNDVEKMATLSHLSQRLKIYKDGAWAAESNVYVILHLDPNLQHSRLLKVLEVFDREDITPLVIYKELNGEKPIREKLPSAFLSPGEYGGFGKRGVEEYKRLEKQFK